LGESMENPNAFYVNNTKLCSIFRLFNYAHSEIYVDSERL